MHTAGRRPAVIMLVLNDLVTDARVRREASTLVADGAAVRVIGRASRRRSAGQRAEDGFDLTLLAVETWLERGGQRAEASPAAPSPRRTRRVRRRGVAVLRRLALKVHRPLVVARYSVAAARSAAGGPVDVVHAHDGNTLIAAALIARRHGAALVYDAHELWRGRNRHGEWRPAARLVEALVERVLLPRADLVFTVSQGIADHLAASHRLRRPPVVVRNVPELRPPYPRAPSLRQLAGAPDGRLLVYTGRAMSGRGLEQAIRVLPRAPADLRLVLLGHSDAVFLDDLRRLAQRWGVAGRLHLAGTVPPRAVPDVIRGAHAALVAIEPTCASYRLALPNKLFEAVHAQVPVIATDLPEMGAWVRTSGVGEVFTPDDDTSLLRALARVLDAPAPYHAAAARVAPTAHWGLERDRFLAAYRLLLAGQGVPASSSEKGMSRGTGSPSPRSTR